MRIINGHPNGEREHPAIERNEPMTLKALQGIFMVATSNKGGLNANMMMIVLKSANTMVNSFVFEISIPEADYYNHGFRGHHLPHDVEGPSPPPQSAGTKFVSLTGITSSQ